MATSDQNDDSHESSSLPDLGDAIDMTTFGQILEMDDSEDDREFSYSIVIGFLEQAEETFEKIEAEIEAENLEELYRLGHFLKGSSATLGLTKMRDSCEKIQRYGKMQKPDGTNESDPKVCLEKITETLAQVKEEHAEAEKVLKKFYDT